MSFVSLSEALRPMAKAVEKYFRESRGLQAIKEEKPVVGTKLVPFVQGKTVEGEFVCIDFSEDKAFPPTVSSLVKSLSDAQIPARVYIALPAEASNGRYGQEFQEAKREGVGILLVDADGNVSVAREALNVLCKGVRKIKVENFPVEMREHLTRAQNTYLDGNPSKGCGELYDLLENVCRRIAKAAHSRGDWSGTAPFDFETAAWNTLIKHAAAHMNFNNLNDLTVTEWEALLSMPRPRNDSGHLSMSISKRRERDEQLRTRFESASDALKGLIKSVGSYSY